MSHHTSTELTTHHAHVAGDCVQTRGPLRLSGRICVKCGSREKGGTIRNDAVSYVSSWIWLTVFISWLLTMIVYFGTRKRINVQYYLCPECADKRKIRTVTSGLVFAVSLLGVIGVVLAGESTLLLAPFLGALCISSLTLTFSARPPLRAIAYDEGCFSLRGISPELLDSMEREQLER